MAQNRIVGNVLIIDSAMGNSFVIDSGGVVNNINQYTVNAIQILQEGGPGRMILTEANTTNIVAIADSNTTIIRFTVPQKFGNLKVPVLTNGTGLIYLA